MERKGPVTPASPEVVLDAAMAQAPRPAMPLGLAARIIAQATAHPQFAPGPQGIVKPVTEPEASGAQVTLIIPAVRAQTPASPHYRRLALGGGIAALAASLIVAIVVSQKGQRVPVIPQTTPAAAAVADIADNSAAQLRPSETPQAISDRNFAGASPSAVTVTRSSKAATDDAPVELQGAAEPTQAALPIVPQIATAEEWNARKIAGPTADPKLDLHTVPSGGLMGPPAPQQGWAFSGSAPVSGTLPGGQTIPTQSARPIPPPQPTGGHH